MSNLFKALKRAERDRQAALDAQQAGAQPDAQDHAATMAAAEKPAPVVVDHVTAQERTTGQPAVVRRQRDAAKQPARPAASASSKPSYAPSRYPGVMVSVVLAIAFAFGVKTWVDSQDRGDQGAAAKPVNNVVTASPLPVAQSAGGNDSALPAPTRIPAALNVEAAGPMQLRLDRTLDGATTSRQDHAVK